MLTSLLVFTVAAQPGPVVAPFSVRHAQQHFVELDGALVARQGALSVAVEARGDVRFVGAEGVSFEVVEVRRDGAPCRTSLRMRAASGAVARLDRACGVEETWTTDDDGIEHALVLHDAPAGRGALRVKVAVRGPWHHADALGHVFSGPGADAPLRYGNAFVVRDGARVPITVEHVDGALELVVPAALVDAPDAFPLHLDPVVSPAQLLGSSTTSSPLDFSNETEPALCWSPTGGRVLVAWVDDRRLVQTDLFGALLDTNGMVVKDALALVTDFGDQHKPALAWNPVSQNFVLAWEHAAGVSWQEIDLGGAPIVGTKQTVTRATSPSLALRPDASVALAYGLSSAVTLRTIDAQSSARTFLTVGEVRKTALAARDEDLAIAVEAVAPQLAQSRVFAFTEASSTPVLAPTRGPAIDPVVAIGDAGVWLAYESAGRVYADRVGQPLGGFFGTHPRLFLDASGLSLGYLGDTINITGLEGPPVATTSVSADDWAVIDVAGTSFGAWTQGKLLQQSDVRAGDVFGAGVRLGQTTAGQRGARVSMRGGLGWAAWKEGSSSVRGASLTIPPGMTRPTGGSTFAITTTAGARIEALDVAMGDGHAVVAVGARDTLQSFVRVVRLDRSGNPTAEVDQLVSRGALARLVGPVVAWTGANYIIAWSDGASLIAQQLVPSEPGTPSPSSVTRTETSGLSELDLDCVAGRCLVAWVSTAGAFAMDLDGGSLSGNVTSVALSNDGDRPCGAWPADGGFVYGCVDAANALVDPAFIPWEGSVVGRVRLGVGRPAVLAWSDGAFVWTARAGELPTRLGEGLAPDVSTERDGAGARGVVVAERFVGTDFAVRAVAWGVSWPDDAGTTPDGGVDAGLDDAGLDDAGLDAGADAGAVTRVDFSTSGCAGCTTGAPALAWLLVVLPWLRRRAALSRSARRHTSRL